jgi:hypothetical protein
VILRSNGSLGTRETPQRSKGQKGQRKEKKKNHFKGIDKPLHVSYVSRDSSVSTVTRLGAGRQEFDYAQGKGLFLLVPRPVLWPIQLVRRGGLSPGVKLPGREADHSPPSSTKVKNVWRRTSTLQYIFMAWCLAKHRDNFAFTF